LNKRTFLLGAGAGAVAIGGTIAWSRMSNIDLSNLSSRAKLTFPPLIDATQTGRFDLAAVAGQTNFVGDRFTKTWGFNQPYLGPVLRLPQAVVKASVTNYLGTDVTSHWHGLLLPGEVDGGPHQPISPGQVWQPELNISQQPSTAWYHTHIHGHTATGVYAGLAGGIIVTDQRDDQRGLPSTYGEDDLFLVLQDKEFSSEGELVYGNDMMSLMHGFTGTTMVVNGQVGAVAEVPKGIVRLRLLNGSNARIFRLSFSDGRPMHLIATDGGFIAEPAEVDSLRLAPGERAEVLVDFANGSTTALISQRDPNAGMGGMMGRFQNFGADILGGEFEVLVFATGNHKGRISNIPATIGGSLPNIHSGTVSRTRRFSLDMEIGGGMMGRGMMGGGMNSSSMAINGKPYDPAVIDLNVERGAVEKWIISSTMLAHPFHVHGVSFQVVKENGRPPSPANAGWKDTVLVEDEIELLAKFDQSAGEQTPFMFHCHILEHEDAGMMGQFTVV
jgi:blue copper oxidase